MKAVVGSAYGPPEDVLDVAEVDVPSAGGDDVLVRVAAAALNPGDAFTILGSPFAARLSTGLTSRRRPVLGRAFAGTVEAVGANVDTFAPGDEVFVENNGGGFAQYAAVPAKRLALKPKNISFEEAAALPLAGVTALQGLRDKGRTQPGDQVLINGASGGVGTLAVQIAKTLGAEVTAVASGRNADMVRSLGADYVVDYTTSDFTEQSGRFQVIFDLIGNHPLARLRHAMTPKGTLVLSSGPPSPTIRRIIRAVAVSPFVSQRLVPLAQMSNVDDLATLAAMVEADQVRPVVHATYPLDQAADAVQRHIEGHISGRIVISIA